MKKTIYMIIILLVVVFLKCRSPIFIRDFIPNGPGFTVYCGNYERNFFVNQNIDTTWTKFWDVETHGSQQNSSIIIYDKYLFVSDLSGRVFAYNNETGKEIGVEKYSGAIPVNPIINNMNLIFILNDSDEKYSTLIFYDVSVRRVLNKLEIKGSVHNEMIKIQDGIIILTDQGDINKISFGGYNEWSIKTDVLTMCTPSLENDHLIFGNQKGEIISIDVVNKKINYRKKISSGFESGVSIKNDKGFIGDNDGVIYCFDTQNGKVIWEKKTGHKIKTIPVLNERDVFVENLFGDIFSFGQTDGKLNWKTEANGVINVTPLLTKNYLLQPNQDKRLDIVDVSNGRIVKTVWYDRMVKTTPVFYKNILYIGVDRGIVNAYKVKTY